MFLRQMDWTTLRQPDAPDTLLHKPLQGFGGTHILSIFSISHFSIMRLDPEDTL